jgi:hypothetical protein
MVITYGLIVCVLLSLYYHTRVFSEAYRIVVEGKMRQANAVIAGFNPA